LLLSDLDFSDSEFGDVGVKKLPKKRRGSSLDCDAIAEINENASPLA